MGAAVTALRGAEQAPRPTDPVYEVSGDCLLIKRYELCLPAQVLGDLEEAAARPRPRRPRRFYWPHKGRAALQQLLLLLLAEAYPYPLSLADLRSELDGLGLDSGPVKRVLHRYYYYHGLAERVGPALYRLREWYWEALNELVPYWRSVLTCLRAAARKGLLADPKFNCVAELKTIIASIRTKASTMRSQRVPEGPNGSQKLSWRDRIRDPVKPRKCSVNIEGIRSYLAEKRPSLYELLGEDAGLAAELIAVLYERARRGKPYLAATTPGSLHAALADEAARVLGSSSILAGTLDWDQVRPVVEALRSADIVYAARYGAEFKLRLDRDFMVELEEAGVAGCG